MGVFDQIRSAFGKETPDAPDDRKKTGGPAAADADKAAAGMPDTLHCVQSGETLWKIAEERLGEGARYKEIFEANRDILESPDHILPGQELKLP